MSWGRGRTGRLETCREEGEFGITDRCDDCVFQRPFLRPAQTKSWDVNNVVKSLAGLSVKSGRTEWSVPEEYFHQLEQGKELVWLRTSTIFKCEATNFPV